MKQVRLRGGYRIFQQKGGLGLTQDSVLLADFCSLRPGERAIEQGERRPLRPFGKRAVFPRGCGRLSPRRIPL